MQIIITFPIKRVDTDDAGQGAGDEGLKKMKAIKPVSIISGP